MYESAAGLAIALAVASCQSVTTSVKSSSPEEEEKVIEAIQGAVRAHDEWRDAARCAICKFGSEDLSLSISFTHDEWREARRCAMCKFGRVVATSAVSFWRSKKSKRARNARLACVKCWPRPTVGHRLERSPHAGQGLRLDTANQEIATRQPRTCHCACGLSSEV